MKLLIASDLHTEFRDQQPLPELPEYDVAILAGDIGNGTKGFQFAEEFFSKDKPVLYITGNHEYYGHDYLTVFDAIRNLARESDNVHFIDCGKVIIDGVQFIGANLWTDFKLKGYLQYPDGNWKRALSDFQVIRNGDALFTPDDAKNIHIEQLAYVAVALSGTTTEKKVVVTHFMPSQECISKFFANNDLNPYFCNDLDSLIAGFKPDLWVYGHTHDKGDNIHSSGKTRMVANPRGYPKERKEYFKWKVIEL